MAPTGVLAPVSAQPTIDTSGNLSVHVSAKSFKNHLLSPPPQIFFFKTPCEISEPLEQLIVAKGSACNALRY